MIIYLAFLFLGIIGLVLSVRSLRSLIGFVKSAERATGRVIELTERKDDEGTFYSPVFMFTAKDRQQYNYQHPVSSSLSSWKIGDEVVFVFDPRDPEKARMLSFSAIFVWPVIALAVSMTLLVTGLGFCFASLAMAL